MEKYPLNGVSSEFSDRRCCRSFISEDAFKASFCIFVISSGGYLMCRYALKSYKPHYVCFNCRKAFKQAYIDDILLRIKKDKIYHELNGKSIRRVGQLFTKGERQKLAAMTKEIAERTVKCPECASAMVNLGLDFRAPKKTAVKEWKIAEGLLAIGKCFHSCGCNGIGYIPKNQSDYRLYLDKALQNYQHHLQYYQKQTREENPDKQEMVTYWADRVKKVDAEIVRQTLLV